MGSRWMDTVGLPKSLNLHSLRHMLITLAGEHGVPFLRVKQNADNNTPRATEGCCHPENQLNPINITVE